MLNENSLLVVTLQGAMIAGKKSFNIIISISSSSSSITIIIWKYLVLFCWMSLQTELSIYQKNLWEAFGSVLGSGIFFLFSK